MPLYLCLESAFVTTPWVWPSLRFYWAELIYSMYILYIDIHYIYMVLYKWQLWIQAPVKHLSVLKQETETHSAVLSVILSEFLGVGVLVNQRLSAPAVHYQYELTIARCSIDSHVSINWCLHFVRVWIQICAVHQNCLSDDRIASESPCPHTFPFLFRYKIDSLPLAALTVAVVISRTGVKHYFPSNSLIMSVLPHGWLSKANPEPLTPAEGLCVQGEIYCVCVCVSECLRPEDDLHACFVWLERFFPAFIYTVSLLLLPHFSPLKHLSWAFKAAFENSELGETMTSCRPRISWSLSLWHLRQKSIVSHILVVICKW